MTRPTNNNLHPSVIKNIHSLRNKWIPIRKPQSLFTKCQNKSLSKRIDNCQISIELINTQKWDITAWRPCFLARSSWFIIWSWSDFHVFHIFFEKIWVVCQCFLIQCCDKEMCYEAVKNKWDGWISKNLANLQWNPRNKSFFRFLRKLQWFLLEKKWITFREDRDSQFYS